MENRKSMETNDKIEETITTYNNIVEEYIQYFNSKDLHGNVQFQKEIDILVNQLEEGSSILDVGTATGDYPKYLTEKCNKHFKVTGIDSSINMINVARKKAPKANFQIMDMRELSMPKNSFDAIICLATLIHVDDNTAISILEKFDAILSSNGIIIINVMEHTSGDKEIYGEGDELSKDTSSDSTRQLDYYKKIEVSLDPSRVIKKSNRTSSAWWLRSANSMGNARFLSVDKFGEKAISSANNPNGVSCAFRIG